MKLIASLIVCLGLCACATDYVAQMSQSNYGLRGLHYSEGTIDPTLLMNGTYASKQMNGVYISTPSCSTNYRCSQQSQQPSSGWNP
jgi:hypothetical protein